MKLKHSSSKIHAAKQNIVLLYNKPALLGCIQSKLHPRHSRDTTCILLPVYELAVSPYSDVSHLSNVSWHFVWLIAVNPICLESKDVGFCTNYSVMWHYDSGLKACRRFWYGGCQRNKNRFDTEAECQAICEDTGSKDGDGKDG